MTNFDSDDNYETELDLVNLPEMSFEDADFARHVLACAVDTMTPLQWLVMAGHQNGTELAEIARTRGVSYQSIGCTWRQALAKVAKVAQLERQLLV